jgi:hypothetical protein
LRNTRWSADECEVKPRTISRKSDLRSSMASFQCSVFSSHRFGRRGQFNAEDAGGAEETQLALSCVFSADSATSAFHLFLFSFLQHPASVFTLFAFCVLCGEFLRVFSNQYSEVMVTLVSAIRSGSCPSESRKRQFTPLASRFPGQPVFRVLPTI